MQVRAKGLEDAAFLDFACAIVEAASRHNVPALVNDRVDMALASGARGVHLGAGDIPPEVARRLLGPAAVIGVTAHSLEEVSAAEGWGRPPDAIRWTTSWDAPAKRNRVSSHRRWPARTTRRCAGCGKGSNRS